MSKTRDAAASEAWAVVYTCESCLSGCSIRITRMRKVMRLAPLNAPSTSTCRAPTQSSATAIAVPIVSVMGCARYESRETRVSPFASRLLASMKRRTSYGSPPNDFTSRMPLTDSCTIEVSSPCWSPRRRWPLRSLRSSGWSAAMSSGATTSASPVSRQLIASRAAIVVRITAPLCSERVTSSVITCLVCAVSVSTRARICPVLWRAKKASGSRCRCP
jgi:hypothetical protein